MEELDAAERQRLFERFGREHGTGATLYAEGDPAEHCFYVLEGRVRVSRRIRGPERTISIVRPGDLFGDEVLEGRATRQGAAIALSPVQVVALTAPVFFGLLGTGPAIAERLVVPLLRRLRAVEEQLDNAILRDAPSRVVHTLLREAAGAFAGEGGHVLAISPLELASRVGLDVDAVKRAVQQLREGGYLRLEGERFVLPDVRALEQLYLLLGGQDALAPGQSSRG